MFSRWKLNSICESIFRMNFYAHSHFFRLLSRSIARWILNESLISTRDSASLVKWFFIRKFFSINVVYIFISRENKVNKLTFLLKRNEIVFIRLLTQQQQHHRQQQPMFMLKCHEMAIEAKNGKMWKNNLLKTNRRETFPL
jgi:hypothetical protein